MSTDAGYKPSFSFYKGSQDVLVAKGDAEFDWAEAASKVRAQIADTLNAQNLSFLFGSGASSLMKDDTQLGVPTMAPLAKEFIETVGTNDDPLFLTAVERKHLKDGIGLNVDRPEFQHNLERLLETLLAFQTAVSKSDSVALLKVGKTVDQAITKAIKFVRTRCSTGAFSSGDTTVLSMYQSFYRKLVYRERTRSRPWVFTTNYDLFNETAMDRLGIPYANGFIGSVERRFNPATFRYSLAEQLDISSQRWSAVDSYVYLCKLHGSVNWIEDDAGFFRIREASQAELPDVERVMIYPTPAKQNASFGSPYVDLFREFQMKVVRDQSVLFVIGYSFGDEHLNNLIFQALTIPSFRMVLLAKPTDQGVVGKLMALGDPRVWIIGGDGPTEGTKAHYFDTFVEHFMPHLPGDKVDRAVQKITEVMGGGGASLLKDIEGLV